MSERDCIRGIVRTQPAWRNVGNVNQTGGRSLDSCASDWPAHASPPSLSPQASVQSFIRLDDNAPAHACSEEIAAANLLILEHDTAVGDGRTAVGIHDAAAELTG